MLLRRACRLIDLCSTLYGTKEGINQIRVHLDLLEAVCFSYLSFGGRLMRKRCDKNGHCDGRQCNDHIFVS